MILQVAGNKIMEAYMSYEVNYQSRVWKLSSGCVFLSP